MAADAAYAQTRREGEPGVITQILDSSANPETGEQTDSTCVTKVRWMVKEPTKYVRLYRAQAVKQDIGETTFVLWKKDRDLRNLTFPFPADQECFIDFDGERYEVVSSWVERTSWLITARVNKRQK